MTQVFTDDGALVGLHRVAGWPVRGGTAPHQDKDRLRGRAIGLGGIRQAQRVNKAMNRAL